MNSKMRDAYISANRQEYEDRYELLNFLSPDKEAEAMGKRDALIAAIGNRVKWGSGGTKLDCTGLSAGCRICGEGDWSCLFINGQCNCKCFYCPSSQDEKGLPTTNSITFTSPEEYVSYLKKLNFRGCSISGGEPLLTPKLTISYIKAVKKAFGTAMYVWMYTNGTLVTKEILSELRDAGLDEIRFDIGAVGYETDALELACGIIPNVSVEIPALPEDFALMKALMPKLAQMGVKFLNLHQLRLTPYNFDKLVGRGYTFLHGDKVTVLDSEMTALELIKFSKDNDINININYCSFVYKSRYQGRGSRVRYGNLLKKSYENLTENGYMNYLSVPASEADVSGLADGLKAKGLDETLWLVNKGKLSFHPSLAEHLNLTGLEVLSNYSFGRQLPSVSYRNPFIEIKISKKRSIVAERIAINESFIAASDATVKFEKIPEHLQEY